MNTHDPIQLWSIHLPEMGDELDRCVAVLSAEETQRAERASRPATGTEFCLTRGLTRRVLGQQLGIAPASIEFTRNENGKPSVQGLEFNISHSKERLLIAVSTDAALGVDIEQRRERPNLETIARRVFTETEQHFLQQSTDRTRCFFDLWTRKEAVIKAIGAGLFNQPDSIEVPLTVPAQTPTGDWYVQALDIAPDYAACLASAGDPRAIQLRTDLP